LSCNLLYAKAKKHNNSPCSCWILSVPMVTVSSTVDSLE
jgi:hypothetical protein